MSDVVKGVKQKIKQAKILFFAIEYKSMQPKPRYGKFSFSCYVIPVLKGYKNKTEMHKEQ